MGIMVLLTGVTGFVGHAILERLMTGPLFELRVAVRREIFDFPGCIEPINIGEVGPTTDWRGALTGVDVVIHTVARVHVMRDTAVDPLEEFRRVNVAGTLNLAQQAVKAGVRRFIFISSIKVNGESTPLGKPYTSDDKPAPIDSYGISKSEAEECLLRLAQKANMDVVIIRPPLVYGPGVKANFLRMMRWVYSGVPLPFGAINNRRSFLALDNLVDLIVACIDHPAAANHIFLASDGEDISTPELLRRTAAALGKPARLFPVSTVVLRTVAGLLGKADFAQRLCGSLQVDISKTRKVLGWTPPVSVDEALRKTARHFLVSCS